jgi:hypothetical protein
MFVDNRSGRKTTMNILDKLAAHHEALQQKLIRDLIKRHNEERLNRVQLQQLFPPALAQPQPDPTAPTERHPMQGLLTEMNEFDDHHAEVMREKGTKHI